MAVSRYIEVEAEFSLQPLEIEAEIDEKMPLGALNVHNYEKLINKPRINGVELIGDKSLSDLGITQEIERQVTSHNLDPYAHEVMRSHADEVLAILNTPDPEFPDVL